jgi:hypothetical protein
MTALDWEPEITGEIRALAKTRNLDGSNLRTADLPRRTIKLALVLIRILNPSRGALECRTVDPHGYRQESRNRDFGRQAFPGDVQPMSSLEPKVR